MTFSDGPLSWTGPAEEDNPSICVWGIGNDWDVLCERCGWTGTGIESEAAANAAADQHLAAGPCRVS